MKNLWNDDEAGRFEGELALRVYTSRLLGRDRTLVLHGGGNTSVKVRETNRFGEAEDILYVKGSGWDLETIEEAGFSPVRLDRVLKLARLEALSDPDMVNELATSLTRAASPAPSVETILHGILPYRYVDHTHADAVLAITNTADGEARIRSLYGNRVVVIPYVMPGFDLARYCARAFPSEACSETIGMVLMNHGIFSFGDTARESYERMIALVQMAEVYLARHRAWLLPVPGKVEAAPVDRTEVAALRHAISHVSGQPLIMRRYDDDRSLSFARRPDITALAHGPATPDHVIRTKRVPMIGRDVEAYAAAYHRYFDQHAPRARAARTMLDPAPRVVLDPTLGLCALGRAAKDATIVGELYAHTMDVIERAQALGGYRALPEQDIFDVEYWDLEQAKLRKGGKPPVFTGEAALVTGAASGIGKACVASLLARGAAVVGLDLDAAVETLHRRPDFLGVRCDVTDDAAIARALDAAVNAFGGLDMLILNAGVFPAAARLAELSAGAWRGIMRTNLDANLDMLRECHDLLGLAPAGGRVVVIGSKNVPAPGPGAAAYSASKAGLTQLARVAALEWGEENIRVNVLHPNDVFDTAIWTDEVLRSRAAHYGLSVEEYRRRNVLKTAITSRDVAELAAEMCGPLFARTTGAQIPIDGGNDRVI
jgi:rhamnose utilization protein RhaD (predicted bifunctional aldolase and dehydrogenase)/NAD(P)-dependent dehydrogenase (short-subunit alcohol dehydrogenase family)